MNPAETKVQRLLQIEALLVDHPEGLTQSEIARRLNVNRSTVYSYLPDLTEHAPIFESDGRLFIDRKAFIVNLKLNLFEAMSLHLATRLLTNRIERHNPHTASLIRKLAQAIEKLSPLFSHHLSLTANVADASFRFQDPHYISVLETLTLAWAEGRKVNIWHRHTETNQVYQYLFSVYFIEPYAVGCAVHTIGLRQPPGEIRTFNLARIERIEMSKESYLIPADFDPTELLEQTWGIWYTDEEPQEVKLRFSPMVAKRLLETRWHPSQQTQIETNGSLLWSAKIAQPKEMYPWIRGWGVDCEVIEPTSLRNQIIHEISAMRNLYIKTKRDAFFELWAKFSKGDETNWHPLIWHMLDSAAVTQLLWEGCLSLSYKSSMASMFELSIEEMGNLLSFWVALHDIGKAGPEFQKKNSQSRAYLEQIGFSFPVSKFKVTGFHATATTLILRRIWASDQSEEMPRKFRNNLAIILGGHHGEFPDNSEITMQTVEDFHVGDARWKEAQQAIYALMASLLKTQTPGKYPEGNDDSNPALVLMAGLTTAADWIASNEDFFPFLNAARLPEDYLKIARTQAREALTTLGWYGWKSKAEEVSFIDLFPEYKPNPIQQAVIDACPDLDSPFLAIIEAPTGSGKTEAAFFLADTVIQRDHKAGIYIAMPTQATSNQMYDRTVSFLSGRYSEDNINLHLVHGAALLNERDKEFKPSGVYGEDNLQESNIHSYTWFLPRKRTLLAPFGVGTVDQTFLSVLKSRHFFLRLFGLSHKVLIFDEVHAYDVYMAEIFKTLLNWLHAVGTSVIILSATLPSQTLKELLRAYGADSIPESLPEFPRISYVTGNNVTLIKAGQVPSRKINIKWIDQNEVSIAAQLKALLSEGGCAAVICNRVNRAQQVFDAIKHAFEGESVEIILFHSRFPYLWRKEIEERVLEKFGKDCSNRPQKAIVVATQVIEQSLDLDFDVMITDLAPIDLLIQRIGRLHRHENSGTPPRRPSGLKQPLCIVSAPGTLEIDTIPDFGADSYIYEPYLLLRTQLALQNSETISLSEETDNLIHAVYSLEKSPQIKDSIWENLQTLLSKMLQNQAKSAQNALNYLIPTSNKTFLGSLKSSFTDDIDDISRKVIKAPTREIDPSVQIVCLIKAADGLHILGDDNIIDLEEQLSFAQVKKCLQASVSMSQWEVLKYFYNQLEEIPESFKRSASLHGHFPVVFEDGIFETDEIILSLDQSYGIRVTNK